VAIVSSAEVVHVGERQASLRQDIVRVAIELGTRHGEDGLTMRGIASRLGLSATALYQHFDGKNAILRAIRLHGAQALDQALRPAFTVADPIERLRAGLARYIAFARDNPWLYTALFGSESPESMSGEERELLASSREQARETIHSAKEKGLLRAEVSAETAAYLLWASVHGLAMLLITGRVILGSNDEAEMDRFVDGFVDLAIRGVCS
jgi:AcrR family transcriptional regulator